MYIVPINIYRREKGLSQQELTDILGVNESTLLDWEKENRMPITAQKSIGEDIKTKSAFPMKTLY